MTASHSDLRRSTVTIDPPNEQTPLRAITAEPTPLDLFYVRSNQRLPPEPPSGDPWTITIDGAVSTPMKLTVDDLRNLPTVRTVAVLECAGNGRTLMDPVPDGTPWDLGGVSVGVFSGTRLCDVLAGTDPSPDVIEWVATGADVDRGEDTPGETGPENDGGYAFPIDHGAAMDGDAMLVWALNDAPLPRLHGGPVRLFVPGSYGMHAVKWVRTITATETPFRGHYRRKYSFYDDRERPDGSPVGPIAVRSLITSHDDGAALPMGEPVTLSGAAWSDGTPIAQVEVGTGGAWAPAEIRPGRGRYAPAGWSIVWTPTSPGRHTIAVRATDARNRTQPLESVWNAHGYANNVVHTITIEVADAR